MNKKAEPHYSEQEAQHRAEVALRAAFRTPPTPMKDIPRKRSNVQRKKPTKKAKASS